MGESEQPLPEPLQRFDPLTAQVSDVLQSVEATHASYLKSREAGRLLPNAVEALRIELTYNSNAIEGSTLTLRETQLVIEGHSPPGQRPMRELYEARNHDRALRTIERWAQERPPGSPLTQQDVLEIHAQVLADIDLQAAGRFRSGRVLIAGTGFVPPGSQKFDVLIPAMIDLANRTGIHPVIQAAELHYNVVAVHPFEDGNGRTARLMMNYHLLRHDYPHAIIEVARRAEYLNSLDEANAGRAAPFVRFVATSLERSMRKIMGND
jgi:Fic family protein